MRGRIAATTKPISSYGQDRIRILYTKPIRWTKMAELAGPPPFKTQKQLAGRALVSDSFSKSFEQPTEIPGVGWYGHRDGYNVLYGDWHAKWYGDPQQRIMYWPNIAEAGSGRYGMGFNVIDDYDWETQPESWNQAKKGAVYVWHIFDVAAGIDVGVDE